MFDDFHRPHGIPTKILIFIKPINYYPLTDEYPAKLNIAKVIPICKKGYLLIVSNYRPIYLLSNINKIFEKLVYSRLYSFLNLRNCIYDLQFGFREKHSTNHALFSLAEVVGDSLDNGNFTCGIFLDLQKAFDTVDHDNNNNNEFIYCQLKIQIALMLMKIDKSQNKNYKTKQS